MRVVRRTALRAIGLALKGPRLGLTRLPGVSALRDAVLRPLASAAYTKLTKDSELVELGGRRLYVKAGDVGIAHELLLHGAYEPTETALFAESVPEGGVVFDIGANIGVYTLIAAERVGPGGRVYAFEPDPVNYSLLCENIELNGYGDQVVALRQAVADTTGRRRLLQHDENFGLHRLSDTVEPEDDWASSTTIETVSLDELVEVEGLERVDVVKMDVEGAEGLVVAGALRLLSSPRMTVFSEWKPDALRALGCDPLELVEQVKRLGFQVEVVDEKRGLRELEREEALLVAAGGGCLNLRLSKIDPEAAARPAARSEPRGERSKKDGFPSTRAASAPERSPGSARSAPRPPA